jgi:hypothetical protein
LDAKLIFEIPDLLAEGRLLDMQALGSAIEAPLLGDGHEISEMSELHWISWDF